MQGPDVYYNWVIPGDILSNVIPLDNNFDCTLKILFYVGQKMAV